MFKETPKSQTWFNKKIEVKHSLLHGLGVFATQTIDKHECIECAPVLLFHRDTMYELRKSMVKRYQTHVLHDYVFAWNKGQVAIAWGYASVYNHGNQDANISYRMRLDLPGIEFIAKREIRAGEELLMHYRHGQRNVEFDISGGKI